jgi:hypothetical protein
MVIALAVHIEDAHRADTTDLGEPSTKPNCHHTTMPSGGSLGEAWRGDPPGELADRHLIRAACGRSGRDRRLDVSS